MKHELTRGTCHRVSCSFPPWLGGLSPHAGITPPVASAVPVHPTPVTVPGPAAAGGKRPPHPAQVKAAPVLRGFLERGPVLRKTVTWGLHSACVALDKCVNKFMFYFT